MSTSTKVLFAVAEGGQAARARETRSLDSLYTEHSDFVWRSLQRLGVHRDDLGDLKQEVFMVVHRRWESFDASSRVTTWLFGICLRVASNYRRRAHRRREQPVATFSEDRLGLSSDPESLLIGRQAREALDALLDHIDPEKRAVFVMFELDELSCGAIAEMMGVPVGTIYSRLYAARQALSRLVSKRAFVGNVGERP